MLGDAVEEGIIPANPVIGIARKGRKQPGALAPADRQPGGHRARRARCRARILKKH